MNILIIEDSISLVFNYKMLINGIAERFNLKVNIFTADSYEQYSTLKHNDYDMAIFDWKINGGNSSRIIDECINFVKYPILITGYAAHPDVINIGHKYDIPIILKPIINGDVEDYFEHAMTDKQVQVGVLNG